MKFCLSSEFLCIIFVQWNLHVLRHGSIQSYIEALNNFLNVIDILLRGLITEVDLTGNGSVFRALQMSLENLLNVLKKLTNFPGLIFGR